MVIDDEHYFPLSKSQIPGNARFYSSNKENMTPTKKFYFKHKSEPKNLVWIGISPRGVTESYFLPSRSLQGKLSATNFGSFHSRKVSGQRLHLLARQDFITLCEISNHLSLKRNINFVRKEDNPTNLPQARPIQDFFGYLH